MIFTFYSYKGGVGRSMALANIAELLYEKGNRVLMIDWDLDSPGLETFFPHIQQKAKENLGLLNLLFEYKNVVSQQDFPQKASFKITETSLFSLRKKQLATTLLNRLTAIRNREYTTKHEFVSVLKDLLSTDEFSRYKIDILKHALLLQPGSINDYIVDVYSDGEHCDGRFLKLLSAGKRDETFFQQYADLFTSVDWKDFYENWAEEQYIEGVRRQIENIAPIILIDSRNGVNEISGVCTNQMADVVVAFTSSNRQSVEGTQKVLKKLQAPETQIARQGRPDVEVVIVPARVEQGELAARNKFEEMFRQAFDHLRPHNWKKKNRSFWDLRIPYVPLYAFEELVAVREKKAKRGFAAQELVEAYEQIWEAMKAKVSPQEQETWKWHYETGKVLIIEDMPTWQSVLKEIVEAKAGESYELAMNQETAKSLLTDHHYKLILLNLNLSIGDLDSGIGYEGLDILDFLKANDQDTPVLLLSSNPLINRDIFDKYPNVKNFFFKGTGGSLVKSLSENIRKYLDD